ncbi:MAG: EAL domain-containing protein [Betaproteobacteria bacterium]|nr:MAG: EAL domain-containing protein [Betaproteobacteria bacterium]
MESQPMQQSHPDIEAGTLSAGSMTGLHHWRWSPLYTAIVTLIAGCALALLLVPRFANPLGTIHQEAITRQAQVIGARALERLTTADNLVRLVSARVESDKTLFDASLFSASNSAVLDTFTGVVVLRDGQVPTIIKGDVQTIARPDAATLSHINNGHTALISPYPGSDRGPSLMRSLHVADVAQPGILVVELAPGFLWRERSEGGDNGYQICVHDGAGNPVFCDESPTTAHVGTQQLTPPNREEFFKQFDSQDQPGGQALLPIAQEYGGQDWIVTVRPPNAESGVVPRDVSMFYMGAGMLCMLATLTMAWLVTGRSTLIGNREQARQGAASSPDARLPVLSQKAAAISDHSQLAATTPDQALEVLKLFSEIDRAILSGAAFERITESVFPRIAAALPGDATALALVYGDDPNKSKLMIMGPDDHREECAIKSAFEARSISRAASMPDGDWFISAPDDAILGPLHQLGLRDCLLLPVYKEGVAAGALIVANRDTRAISGQARALARDIAHRLGVAYTSSVRGQQLMFHSLYDSTTELPNRKYFESRLSEEISRARRESRHLALLLVDLDEFKKVNDSFGHEGGDILLEQTSMRMKTCLRTDDLVARVGSDEFGVLLPTISQDTDAAAVAQKLIDTLAEPYILGGREHHLSATIGVAVFPEDGKSAHSLLRSADFAMHAAKREGGATYSTFEAQSSAQAKDQAALAMDLRQAIAKSELTLYFQPQIDLRQGEIIGAEALIRWQHHARGMVMPGAFISIAEQTDLIERVGEFVRREASAQFRQWEREGMAPMRVSVNMSSREFKRNDIVDRIENTLIASGLRPFSLELEITESLLVESSEQVLNALKALSDRGVRIAIDDFGTGYSSMAYLKNIPFNVLKIDRSFVKDIGAEDGSDSIVNAIIGVAQGLGKEIVAEGIETETQRAFLAENGCDMGQGYLWSRPVPADEFTTFVRNWNQTARRFASID